LNADTKSMDAVVMALDRDLRWIRRRLHQGVDDAVSLGRLTGPQKSAMHVLVASEGLSLKCLSQELGLSHSTVSGIVDRLEARGMVQRQTDDTDRRVTKILVSQEVRAYMKDVWPELETSPLLRALRVASAVELDQITEGIRGLRGLLERAGAAPNLTD